MALLFMDSFDHYVTADILEKYAATVNGPTITPTGGRRGSGCITLGGFVSFGTRAFTPADNTVVVGAAVKFVGTGQPAGAFVIRNNTQAHCTIVLETASGALLVRRGGTGGTLIGTASTGIPANTFSYIEVKVVIHPSAGSVEIRLNGSSTPVLNLTGQNTTEIGTSVWNNVYFGESIINTSLHYDDLYILDGSGAAPWNGFLGDCRVDARVPSGAGAATGWTPSAGANWQCVDDATPNDDTDYVSAPGITLTDHHAMQDAPSVGAAIYGIQHCLNMRKTDAGACTVSPAVMHSSTVYLGAAISPTLEYTYYLQPQQTNPGTSAQWTEAHFNAAEFGYKRVS